MPKNPGEVKPVDIARIQKTSRIAPLQKLKGFPYGKKG